MANDNDLEQQDQGNDGDPSGGGDDLNGMLNAQDTTFVTDEKKPLSKGTLVMAGILLACGAGTYVMYTRSAPGAGPTAESAQAQSTINEFLKQDARDVSKMKDMLKDTGKVVQQFISSPGKKQVPISELQTNPFRVAAAEPEAAVDDGGSKRQQEEQRAATKKAAEALSLQFVMSGKKKSCMINNTIYREGQSVEGFKVESISPDTVIIRKDDARFALQIKK